MPEQAFTVTVKPVEASQLEMLEHEFSPGTRSKPHYKRYEVQKSGEGVYMIAWHEHTAVGHFLLWWGGPDDERIRKFVDVTHSAFLGAGAKRVPCLASPRAIWDEVPHSFEGITFARFLLAWWCQTWDRGRHSPLANEILARTGLSATALREQVEQDPMLDTLCPPRWLALGQLISQYASEEPVVSFLDQGVNQLQQLYERFCAQVKPAIPPWLVLGGSIWSHVLFERVLSILSQVGIPVRHSQGNPAWGTIRFRRTNPAVQLEPWASRFTKREDGA